MNKALLLDPTFENLVDSYVNARSRAGESILEMASVCLKAKEQLKKKMWFEWLEDRRIKLKRTQAKKLIAVAKVFSKGGQSTDLLNKKGIEEAYLLTRIEKDSLRDELAGGIIEADFTVKQTRQVVAIVKDKNKTPIEAIEEVKNLPKLIPDRQERKTISVEQYNKLKTEYEKLLKEKQDLESKLEQHMPVKSKLEVEKDTSMELKEPVKSDKPDYTLDKVKRSIVIKGWELPVPPAMVVDEEFIDRLEIAAVNMAKNYHNLDLS